MQFCSPAVPPLMLHFIAPLNLLLRKKLVYRITDFHPECLIAERGHAGPVLGLLMRLTQFWRRRVDEFEVLGLDQARRLMDIGIPQARLVLKADPSPVVFAPESGSLARPARASVRLRRHSVFRELGHCS